MRREQFMLFAPLILWIGVIFVLSSGQGASTRTSLIIRPLLEFLFPNASFETIAIYHGIIRKVAHLTEYAVLGFLGCRAFAATRSIAKYSGFAAIGLVVLTAATDEFSQSFNPARTGSSVDVVIDVSGGVFGTLVYYVVRSRRMATPIISHNRDD